MQEDNKSRINYLYLLIGTLTTIVILYFIMYRKKVKHSGALEYSPSRQNVPRLDIKHYDNYFRPIIEQKCFDVIEMEEKDTNNLKK